MTLVSLDSLMPSLAVKKNEMVYQAYFGFVNQHKPYTGDDLIKELTKWDMATGLTGEIVPI